MAEKATHEMLEQGNVYFFIGLKYKQKRKKIELKLNLPTSKTFNGFTWSYNPIIKSAIVLLL
jgi:hypothetical protein